MPQQLERRAAELRRSLKYLRQHFSNARFVVRLSHRPQEEREGTKADRAFCTLLSSDALTSTRADFAHPRSQWRCSSFGIYSARSLSPRASPSSVRPLARPSSPPSRHRELTPRSDRARRLWPRRRGLPVPPDGRAPGAQPGRRRVCAGHPPPPAARARATVELEKGVAVGLVRAGAGASGGVRVLDELECSWRCALLVARERFERVAAGGPRAAKLQLRSAGKPSFADRAPAQSCTASTAGCTTRTRATAGSRLARSLAAARPRGPAFDHRLLTLERHDSSSHQLP